LPQSLRFVWRCRRPSIFLLAICSAIFSNCAPRAFAQQPAPTPPVASAPNASTPVAIPAAPQGSRGTTGQLQLQLARQQGTADTAVLDWVLANSGPIKGDTRAGQMRIAFSITPAEGWWDKAGNGRLAWHEAPDDAIHLRVFVLDLVDGRIVPGLTLRATLIDANGNEQSAPLDFGWYPLINAYGGNIPMDTDSSYTLRIDIDPVVPHREGSPADHATVAEFPPVEISLEAIAALPRATTVAVGNEAELLKPRNAAFSSAITELWQRSASGAEKPAGDYFVGYALESSGVAMQVGGARLHPKNLIDFSGKENVRLSVLPRDSRTGRFIPNLKPRASLIAPDGRTYGPGEMPLLWHSWINRYQRDARISRNGSYKLRVHFDAPGFRRWGRESERFASSADVEFDAVSLKPESENLNQKSPTPQ